MLVTSIILIIYNSLNGNSLIDSCVLLVVGLISVITLLIELPKSIYADRNKKESEEYIRENLFDKPEEVIKEFVQNL